MYMWAVTPFTTHNPPTQPKKKALESTANIFHLNPLVLQIAHTFAFRLQKMNSQRLQKR